MEDSKAHTKDNLQLLIGKVLRYGVWLSAALTSIGLLLLLIKPIQPIDEGFSSIPTRFHLANFFRELSKGESYAIITLGIMVLLLTPVLRVLFAIIGYLKEKDRLYFFISLIVLLILVASFLLGVAH